MGDRAAAEATVTEASRTEAFRTRHEYGVDMVPARITGNTVVVTDLKWKYNWEEVRFTESTAAVAAKSGGLTNTTAKVSYNWNELANTGTLWAPLGNPVNVPAGFKVMPIAVGTPILLFPIRDTTGAQYWVFDKANAIDGECPLGIEEEET